MQVQTGNCATQHAHPPASEAREAAREAGRPASGASGMGGSGGLGGGGRRAPRSDEEGSGGSRSPLRRVPEEQQEDDHHSAGKEGRGHPDGVPVVNNRAPGLCKFMLVLHSAGEQGAHEGSHAPQNEGDELQLWITNLNQYFDSLG